MKRHDVTHPSPSKQVKAIQSTQHVLLLPADPYHTLSSPLLSGYSLPLSEHQQNTHPFPPPLVDTPKRHTHSTRDVYMHRLFASMARTIYNESASMLQLLIAEEYVILVGREVM